MPAGGWEVHLGADRNGELEHGQLGIVSTLATARSARIRRHTRPPASSRASSAAAAARRARPRSAQAAVAAAGAARRRAPATAAAPTAPRRRSRPRDSRERARLTYDDEQGPHVFLMRKDPSRSAAAAAPAWVDVQIVGSSKVSREHLRLRGDGAGRFFIQDVSLWGTSVDGVPIPPAVKSADGVAQPGAGAPAAAPRRGSAWPMRW